MGMAPNAQSATLMDVIRDMLEVMRSVEEKGRLETEEKERLKTQNEQLVEDKGILASHLTQVLNEKRLLEMENAHKTCRLEKQIVQTRTIPRRSYSRCGLKCSNFKLKLKASSRSDVTTWTRR